MSPDAARLIAYEYLWSALDIAGELEAIAAGLRAAERRGGPTPETRDTWQRLHAQCLRHLGSFPLLAPAPLTVQ